MKERTPRHASKHDTAESRSVVEASILGSIHCFVSISTDEESVQVVRRSIASYQIQGRCNGVQQSSPDSITWESSRGISITSSPIKVSILCSFEPQYWAIVLQTTHHAAKTAAQEKEQAASERQLRWRFSREMLRRANDDVSRRRSSATKNPTARSGKTARNGGRKEEIGE